MSTPCTFVAIAALGLVMTVPTSADIVPIEPFEGEFSDGFDSYFAGFYSELDMFFDSTLSGTESNATMVPAFLTSFSSFGGSTILARSAPHMAHVTGPVDFVFPTPVRMFGGYVATNSGMSGGIVEFFDANDMLIDTMPLDVTFTPGTAEYSWNGWLSDTPFARIRFTSNGTLGGFLGLAKVEWGMSAYHEHALERT